MKLQIKMFRSHFKLLTELGHTRPDSVKKVIEILDLWDIIGIDGKLFTNYINPSIIPKHPNKGELAYLFVWSYSDMYSGIQDNLARPSSRTDQYWNSINSEISLKYYIK